MLLVQRYWPWRTEAELRELAQSLRGLLEPILKMTRPDVTAELRSQCERLVREWDERSSGAKS